MLPVDLAQGCHLIFARQWIGRFGRCERGNFAIIAALAAVPLLGVSGLALDYARIHAAQDKLQTAVDSAALAAAASGEPVHVMQSIVNDFVKANFGTEKVDIETEVGTDTMQVEARYRVATPILAAAGQPRSDVVARAEIRSPVPLRQNFVSAGASPGDAAVIEKAMARFEMYAAHVPARERDALRQRFREFLENASREFSKQGESLRLSQ
jgi:Flp pilus assembly protein TadG